MGGHVYPSVFAQSSEDNYILPVILVYPAVWAEKNTVPPTIEINVLGQFQEDDVLDGAEGDEKKALDTESSTKYFEIPKSDVNAGEEIEVCISAARADDYPDLSKCQQAMSAKCDWIRIMPVPKRITRKTNKKYYPRYLIDS